MPGDCAKAWLAEPAPNQTLPPTAGSPRRERSSFVPCWRRWLRTESHGHQCSAPRCAFEDEGSFVLKTQSPSDTSAELVELVCQSRSLGTSGGIPRHRAPGLSLPNGLQIPPSLCSWYENGVPGRCLAPAGRGSSRSKAREGCGAHRAGRARISQGDARWAARRLPLPRRPNEAFLWPTRRPGAVTRLESEGCGRRHGVSSEQRD